MINQGSDWITTGGWICPLCGTWVTHGQEHTCPSWELSDFSTSDDPQLTEIILLLKDIKRLLQFI